MVFLYISLCKKKRLTKILIIRLSSFGDIVLTTPVLRCLKNQMFASEEGCEIHYLVKKKFFDVIKANPYVSKFHLFENGLSEIIPALKQEGFDYIIDLHNNFRSLLVKRKLGILAFSVNKINIQKWLMVNFKWNFLPEAHIVQRYLDTLKPFGIENDGLGLDYFIPPEDEVSLQAFPAAHQQGFIAFVIGGNYYTKKLPAEKIISVCRKVNLPVVLIGGSQDNETGEKITAEIPHLCYNLCGKLTINQSASVVKQAKKVISNDTGLMHIAAALKKEIVSVWGNTIPEFGMYPYYGKSQVANLRSQVPGLSCRPCSKLGFSKCPKKHFRCMNLIDEDEIMKAVLT